MVAVLTISLSLASVTTAVPIALDFTTAYAAGDSLSSSSSIFVSRSPEASDDSELASPEAFLETGAPSVADAFASSDASLAAPLDL
jgi:hypothetical protein|tara:strand:- start:159 stop:416 length:258 start_codon:yes stop_codon:yes gene_type:complete